MILYDVCPVNPKLSELYANTNILSYVKSDLIIVLNDGATTSAGKIVGNFKVGTDVLS